MLYILDFPLYSSSFSSPLRLSLMWLVNIFKLCRLFEDDLINN